MAVFHQGSISQGAVLPAVFVQVEKRDDMEPLRVVLQHRPGMVESNYPERLEAALRNGLPRLNYDPRGLTVNIGFGGPFLFTVAHSQQPSSSAPSQRLRAVPCLLTWCLQEQWRWTVVSGRSPISNSKLPEPDLIRSCVLPRRSRPRRSSSRSVR